MSKKTLLSESQIRQFMMYANIGNLADDFISKSQINEGREGIEEGDYGLEEGVHAMDEDVHAEEEVDLDMDLDDTVLDDDEGEDEDAAPVGGDVAEEVGLAVARAVRDALQPFGVSVDVEETDGPMDDDGVDLDDIPMDDEVVTDLDMDDEVVTDLDMDDEEEEEVMDLDEAVERITQRVTRRIRGLTESKRRRTAKSREQQIEDVTDRILDRIKNISK